MKWITLDRSLNWYLKLVPYLSGRAQQAYVSLPAVEAAEYVRVKKIILLRYDIKEDTYL